MSSDTNINVKFTVTDSQLRKMFAQLKKLQTTVKSMSKNFTKLGSSMKNLESKFGTTNKKVSKLTKTFTNQKKKQDALRKSLTKLTASTKKYGNATDKVSKSGNRASKSLGFTGLALGAVGGAALFAGNQIRDGFLSVLEDTVPILSEISRLNIFASFQGGTLDIKPEGFENQLDSVISKAQEFGVSIEDMATLAKEVEKSVPAGTNVEAFTNAVAGFAILEKGVPVAQLAADFATIKSNFEELPVDRIADLALAFSGATKLSFSAGAKSIGFAAQAAKRLNTPLDELLKTMVAIVNAVPGDRGTAGRGVRRLVSGLLQPEVLAGLQNFGVEIFDINDKFVGLGRVMSQLADIYRDLNDQEQIRFIDDLSLTENALTAFLAFADKSVAERKKLAEDFNVTAGSAGIAVEEQKKQPEEEFTRLKNSVDILKIKFVQGLIPALNELNAVLKDVFADKELLNTLKILGESIGQTLAGSIKAIIPIFQTFGNILKNNEPVVKALGVAFVALTAALTGFGILFTLLGAFFALTFVHEALIGRSAILGARVTFVTKAYVGLIKVVNIATASMSNFLKSVIAGTIGQTRLAGALTLTNFKLKLHGIHLALAGLATRVFASASIASALAVASAWLIALAPIAIVVGAILASIVVLNAFRNQIVGLGDLLDTTGVAGKNFGENMDEMNAALSGDFGPTTDRFQKDMDDFNTRIQLLRDSWGVFISDLQQTQVFQTISGAIQGIVGWFQSGITQVQNWIASLSFNIPDVWTIFGVLLGAIPSVFVKIGEAINQFLVDNGFPMPEIWTELDKLWSKLADVFKPITDELSKFVEALNFELPAPLVELKNIIDGVFKAFSDLVNLIGNNPIVKGIGEIFGIGGKLIENISPFGDNTQERGKLDLPTPTSFFAQKPFQGPLQQPLGGGFIGPQQEQQGDLRNANLDTIFDTLREKFPEGTPIDGAGVGGEANEAGAATNELVASRNEFLETGNEILASANTLQTSNSQILGANSVLETKLNDHVILSIIEFAKNINMVSEVTTTFAAVQVMLFRLIGEGNRAAGKLASLKVSSTGKFSISDPGISAVDQANIAAAQSSLQQTKAAQTKIDIGALTGDLKSIAKPAKGISGQPASITINNEITTNNASNVSAEDIVAEMNNKTAETLQKVFIQTG